MQRRTQDGQEEGEPPGSNDHHQKVIIRDPLPAHDAPPSVKRNQQDEETARDVADVDEPSLREARRRRSHQLAFRQPVEAEDEAERLLQVGEEELVDEDDVLVVSDVGAVVATPEDHAEGDPYQQDGGRDDRQESEGSYAVEAFLGVVVERYQAVWLAKQFVCRE